MWRGRDWLPEGRTYLTVIDTVGVGWSERTMGTAEGIFDLFLKQFISGCRTPIRIATGVEVDNNLVW